MAKFITQSEAKLIRFVRNTPYRGVDYGPDYDEQEAVVQGRDAMIYIAKGRAVEVVEDSAQSEPENAPANRDSDDEKSEPETPQATKPKRRNK